VKILLIGDIIGQPGRKAVAAVIRDLKKENNIELTVANVENLAGGFGVNEKSLNELKDLGIDVFTSGNHIWAKKEVEDCWAKFPTLLRPLNYPPGVTGRGECIVTSSGGTPVGVVNLMGRVFMPVMVDDPFRAAKEAVASLRGKGARVILIDIHAEASSEKVALWRHLDGEASVVYGTHTHVPTADARVSAKGTGFISDLGLSGGYGGVIGMQSGQAMRKMLQAMPGRYEPEETELEFWGLVADVDEATGRTRSVTQMRKQVA
jgi:metallophosphoesterase (TIGR00282 family)